MGYYNATSINSTHLVKITPEMAAIMLEKNQTNRRLNPRLVSQYAKDMKNGEWKTTHQGIAINCLGFVVDGQHRLAAIVESGVAIWLLVTAYNESIGAMASPIDMHMRRKITDITGIPARLAETLTFIIREVLLVPGRRYELDVMAFHDLFSSEINSYVQRIGLPHQKVLSTAPIKAAALLAFINGYDWLDQYAAMHTLSIERFEKSTSVLYRKLVTYEGNTSGVKFRREAFGYTYLIATAQGMDIKGLRSTAIPKAYDSAKKSLLDAMRKKRCT